MGVFEVFVDMHRRLLCLSMLLSGSGREAGCDSEEVQHGMQQAEPPLHFALEAVMCGRALGRSAQQPLKTRRAPHRGGGGGLVVGGGDEGCGGGEGRCCWWFRRW